MTGTDVYFYGLLFILVLYPAGYALLDGIKYLAKRGGKR